MIHHYKLALTLADTKMSLPHYTLRQQREGFLLKLIGC